MGSNGKDGFGAEAEAWVGGAECQTSATADKHGSVSQGEGVGGDEGNEKGGRRRGEAGNEAQGSSANPVVVREDMVGTEARTSFSSFEHKTFCTHLNMLVTFSTWGHIFHTY